MSHVDRCVWRLMDSSQRDRLSQLVEELTMSGHLQLNQEKMKEIKKICKCVTVWLVMVIFWHISTKRQKLLWPYYKKDLVTLGTHIFTGKEYKYSLSSIFDHMPWPYGLRKSGKIISHLILLLYRCRGHGEGAPWMSCQSIPGPYVIKDDMLTNIIIDHLFPCLS